MKNFVLIMRILALPSVLMTAIIAIDIISPYDVEDQAIISGKYISNTKHGISHNIKAHGAFDYNEAVSKSFYEHANSGDSLKVNLSRIFMEWKSVEVIKSGTIVAVEEGADIYYMGLFGMAFLLTTLSFKSVESIRSNKLILIGIPVLEITAVAVFVKVLLFMLGYIEKV